MKKILALVLALCMVFALCACGQTAATDKPAAEETQAPAAEESNAPAAEPEAVTYKVAMITDYGDITDQSFNQTTYEACKAFCEDNGVEFSYFKPAGDNTADRVAMIESAIDKGYNIIVMPGYAFGGAIKEAQDTYPDVKFVALDVSEYDITSEFYKKDASGNATDELLSADNQPHVSKNVYSAVYKEELCGYMAGYAAVKMGYKSLGFLGGMAVPAVQRYGYGFVQGVDAAAKEMGLSDVKVNYVYGGQFYGDADITAAMDTWYKGGTQVVFACGGGIYTSAVEAALKSNGYVVGVDVDQNYIGVNGVADGSFAYNPFITSAMKGLTEAVNTALSDIEAGDWSEIAASNGNFGLEDGDYVGLPTDADSWNFETFTTDEYEALKEKIKSGEIAVDNSSDDSTKPTVSEFTTVNYIQ